MATVYLYFINKSTFSFMPTYITTENGIKRDGTNKNGCSSPTSDDSGINFTKLRNFV